MLDRIGAQPRWRSAASWPPLSSGCGPARHRPARQCPGDLHRHGRGRDGAHAGQADTDAINRASRYSFGEATGITQTVRNYGASLGFAILGTVLIIRFRPRSPSRLPPRACPAPPRRRRRPRSPSCRAATTSPPFPRSSAPTSPPPPATCSTAWAYHGRRGAGGAARAQARRPGRHHANRGGVQPPAARRGPRRRPHRPGGRPEDSSPSNSRQAGVSLMPSPTGIEPPSARRSAIRSGGCWIRGPASRSGAGHDGGNLLVQVERRHLHEQLLHFAALAVLCLFPFMIIVAAESGSDMRDVLIAASVSIRRPETSTSSCPREVTQDDPHRRGRGGAPRGARHRLHLQVWYERVYDQPRAELGPALANRLLGWPA